MRFIFIFTICCFLSCSEDAKVNTKPTNIEGRWDFYKAFRNGKETNTLTSGYFKFIAQDSSIESNIFQVSEPKNYNILKGNQLVISGKESFNFTIDKLEGDTMILKGQVWLYNMEFRLKRNNDPNAPVQVETSEVQ